ncbi:MAG TPA: MarR family transcriptional regulator [Candidatus Limnocylindrales bacterium]|jgi:DNA-binding MarR family transcriptional regulator
MRTSILLDSHFAYHTLGRLLRRKLRTAQLSLSEAVVLRVLARNPRVTVAALRVSTGLGPTTTSTLLRRLEDRGLVRRRQLDSDRRWVVVRPTAAGLGTATFVDSALREIEERITSHAWATAEPSLGDLVGILAYLDGSRYRSKLD